MNTKEKNENPRRYAGKSKSMCKKTINGKSQDKAQQHHHLIEALTQALVSFRHPKGCYNITIDTG